MLLLLAFRRLSRSLPRACVALAIYLVLDLGGLAVLRPQVVGELCFAALLLTLSWPVLSRRALVFLPVVFVLWANAHASFVAGFLMLGGLTAGRVVESFRSRHAPADRPTAGSQLRRLLVVSACCLAAVAVLNPAGPRIFWNALQMARHPNVLAMDEWQPLRFRLGFGAHWAYVASLVLVLGAEVRRPGRFSPSTGVLLLLFALQPLWHQRALVWWLMVAPWLMVGARAAARTSKCDEHSPDALPSLRKTLLACAAVLLAVGWSIPVQWLVADAPASVQRSVADATPWRLAAVLQDPDRREPLPELAKQLQVHYPGSRFTGRIFASETLGDYLVWQLSPQQQVFIYTHVHLFSPEHWRLCTIVRSGAPGWRDVLDRYGVNLVVVEADIHPRLCQLLHAERGWRVVSAGRLFIALRTPPRPLP